MKPRNLACVVFAALCMASCTAESESPVYEEAATFSLVRDYNARSVETTSSASKNLNLSALPAISVAEANQILSALRTGKQSSGEHHISRSAGEGAQTFLTVSSTLHVQQSHRFTVELDLIQYEDDGSLYYKANRGTASSPLYAWDVDGFRLASSGTDGTYRFECSSYLYFKIVDDEITYIQVPMAVKGTYHPDNHDTSFTISL